MTLLFPFGLLLLLAIPVLIIIYIIKNKYKEKTVSSSYIWELSRKFLKKKNPLNSISNLLNLIMQCLCIAFLSFALADPVFNFQNGAENEVFILDASASMSTLNEDGISRFDEAKNKIEKIVDDAVDGTTFTLIVGDSNSRTICKQIQDKDIFHSFIDRVEIDMADSDLDGAISLAQSLASQGDGSHFSLFTDKEVETDDSLAIYQVGDTFTNYSIDDLQVSEIEDEEGAPQLFLEADVISYSGDTSLDVEFYIDDVSVGKVTVDAKENEPIIASLSLSNPEEKYSNYSSIKAKLLMEDYLSKDSEYILYNFNDFDTTNVLIVSYSPFYFESVFNALNNNGLKINYTTITPDIYSLYSGSIGYDLTIFDSYSPDQLPVDSAVWLCNTGSSIPHSGFYAQKEYTVDDPGIKATYAENISDPLYQELTKNLVKREITIKTYMRYTLNSRFTTILSYDNLPFIFAGRNEYDQRQIVFNFDLHNSNFPLLADFVILMRNCVAYSNPSILTEFNYKSHDIVTFSFPDTAISCEITAPSGKVDYLSPTDIQSYTLEEVGTYSIKVGLATGKEKMINLFSAFPSQEREPLSKEDDVYQMSINSQTKKAVRIFDAILPMVIVASAFLVTDWIIYSHEQF